MRETTGAARLRQLAGNPLILGLMWRLREEGVVLPTGGQAVFAAFIRWLIRSQTPARRRIAEVDDPLDLDGNEVEAALALAAQESPSPALPVAEARQAVTALLADDAAGAGADAALRRLAVLHYPAVLQYHEAVNADCGPDNASARAAGCGCSRSSRVASTGGRR